MTAAVVTVSVALPDGGLKTEHDQTVVVDGTQITFDYLAAKDAEKPVVVFLQAIYYSNNRRAKTTALEIAARRTGLGFLVFDYYGTG
jgi:hypothetical protein